MLSQYYKIVIKDNNCANVYKIDFNEYNDYQNNFEYVYHTKYGEKYPLTKYWGAGFDIIVIDDKHLYGLLDDLREQGFCDTIEFSFIDDYFNGNYAQFGKVF